ncbi:hypothetical protein KAFR_0C00730 [Kazachstania africana CBS 2517]|uniref:Uncharacterized protein n=1 Tax=Kazachstania africana (strain ATCC 22294 / BCRC 22015 / CBS 2517 / CECT 1963 / NBRC 1671 / NRRL Y-8276) TaxID=1071382 RepID=H2ARR8_KAZAF|nr:hypothetical protein KAFR_0C00730 [Kazachstania africana CBS 2517]CCF57068.1 hypothetical protein KAFR_0C00730 [Kazachstania africana CBS 2517]
MVALHNLCCTDSSLLFGTIITNRKRYRLGQAPIRGTSWLTPPSYRQSQRQYNEGDNHIDYVPEYTETANVHDLGYFDERGEFHMNDKVERTNPGPVNTSTLSDSSLEHPRPAVVRDDDSSDDLQFTRPAYTAAGASSNQYYSSSTQNEELSSPQRAKLSH